MKNRYLETIKTWNKVAQLYEEKFMDLTIYNDSYETFCNELPHKNSTVLEIGCGPGNITKQILNIKPDLTILATDVSENMLSLAKKNNPTIKTQLLDARNVSSLKQSFDGVICGFIIPYLSKEDVEKLCDDCFSALNQDGILYFSYVEGSYLNSGFQSSSSGDRAYFYYYSTEFITSILIKNRFRILHQLPVTYKKTNNATEVHSIIIAQKTS